MTNGNTSPETKVKPLAYAMLFRDLETFLANQGKTESVDKTEIGDRGETVCRTYVERSAGPIVLPAGWKVSIREINGESQEAFFIGCDKGLIPVGENTNVMEINFGREGADLEPFETVLLTPFGATKEELHIDPVEVELLRDELGLHRV